MDMQFFEIRWEAMQSRHLIRRAVTLVELMISIAIIVGVMAVAVPVVRLATNGNKVSSAVDQVSSFINSVKQEAELTGHSYLIFERNHNFPNLCYRMYRGKSRPNYRGEDQTSYAVPAGIEYVELSTFVDSGLRLECHVFYLYNVDVNRIRPFEYLNIDGRLEQYEIVKARTISVPTRTVNEGVYRPVVKVFTLSNTSPTLHLSEMDALDGPGVPPVATSNTYYKSTPADPWTDWSSAFVNDPAVEFWPNTPITSNFASYSGSTDIPRAVGTPIRIYDFSVTQPPYVDELDVLNMPDGVAIHLNASGFDADGSVAITTPGATTQNFSEVAQLAFPNATMPNFVGSVRNLDADIKSGDATAKGIIQAEIAPAGLPVDSVVRTAYFPMIEFNSRGQIERVFACSPLQTAIFSEGTDIVRQSPFQPSSPLFLLVGTSTVGRVAVNGFIESDDYWLSLNNMTGRISKFKAEDGAGDVDGNGVVNVRDSRIVSVGGISE